MYKIKNGILVYQPNTMLTAQSSSIGSSLESGILESRSCCFLVSALLLAMSNRTLPSAQKPSGF